MVKFYGAVGANLQAKKVSLGGQIYYGSLGQVRLSLHQVERTEVPPIPNFVIHLEVSSLDTILQKIRDLNVGEILMDAQELPHGKVCYLKDPEGYSLELVESRPDS